MKKIFTSTIISIIMIVSLFTPQTAVSLSADAIDEESVRRSMSTVVTSINELGDVVSMTDDQKTMMTNMFTDFAEDFKNIGGTISGIVAPINGTITFLRLIGLMKDPTTTALFNIQTQLADISSQLTTMNNKLDALTKTMIDMKATEEFHFRATTAQTHRQNWATFRSTYMEQGLDNLMLNYNAQMANAWKDWFDTEANSKSNLNSILIWYHNTGSGETVNYELQNTLKNDFDAEHESPAEDKDNYILYADEFDKANDRLIALNGDFFAGAKSIEYNINTYRENLKSYVIRKINEDLGEEGFTNIKAWNIKKEMLNEEMLNEIADQAVDVITFKLSDNYINSSADFSNNVLNQYKLYCEHLLANTEGVDALLQTMYLTHAFEFEIKKDLKDLINLMSLQTGTYSAFVANIISMSNYIQDKDKGDFTTRMCNTLDGLANLKKKATTGEDRYSYITNSVIDYGNLSLSSEVSVDWKEIITTAYVASHGGTINVKLTDSSNNSQSTSMLVGDAPALLLSYMVRSNGGTFNHEYMNNKLTVNKQRDCFNLVTSYNGDEEMTQDTNARLATNKVIGSYFEGDPDVYLASLPSKAEFGYVNIHRRGVGTIFDGTSSSVSVYKPLIAVAAYGESHTLWSTDEAALMFGPKDTGVMSTAVKTETTYEDTFAHYYTKTLYGSVDYNALISIPLKNNEALTDTDSPLYRYNNDTVDKIAQKDENHIHEWDEGTIIKDATDNELGIIRYTCLNEKCNDYSYTRLYDNKQKAILTFDLDGGTLEGFDNQLSREFNVGSIIILPKEPKKDGYTFQYWSESDHPADSSYDVTGDRTFKAVWIKSHPYQLDSKNDKEWYNDSYKEPYIRVIRKDEDEATLAHFKGVRVDESLIARNCYDVESGSLILKFKPSFLKSLPNGAHLVEVLFDDGKAEFTLNIQNGYPKNQYRVPITGIE